MSAENEVYSQLLPYGTTDPQWAAQNVLRVYKLFGGSPVVVLDVLSGTRLLPDHTLAAAQDLSEGFSQGQGHHPHTIVSSQAIGREPAIIRVSPRVWFFFAPHKFM